MKKICVYAVTFERCLPGEIGNEKVIAYYPDYDYFSYSSFLGAVDNAIQDISDLTRFIRMFRNRTNFVWRVMLKKLFYVVPDDFDDGDYLLEDGSGRDLEEYLSKNAELIDCGIDDFDGFNDFTEDDYPSIIECFDLQDFLHNKMMNRESFHD